MGRVTARLRTIIHATEDERKVRDALLRAMGALDDPKALSRLQVSRLKGQHGNPIQLVEGRLTQAGAARRFQHALREQADVVRTLAGELDTRLDEHGVLRFRLDKQGLVMGAWRVTRGSDAVQVEIHFGKNDATDKATGWLADDSETV